MYSKSSTLSVHNHLKSTQTVRKSVLSRKWRRNIMWAQKPPIIFQTFGYLQETLQHHSNLYCYLNLSSTSRQTFIRGKGPYITSNITNNILGRVWKNPFRGSAKISTAAASIFPWSKWSARKLPKSHRKQFRDSALCTRALLFIGN